MQRTVLFLLVLVSVHGQDIKRTTQISSVFWIVAEIPLFFLQPFYRLKQCSEFMSAILSSSNDIPAGQKYEVVFPRKLHVHHKRDTKVYDYPDLVQYGLEVNGQPMVLHLEKTEDLISEDYTETHYLKDGSLVTTSPEIKDHCFYQGYVKNDSSSKVSLSTCNGLSGIIAIQESKFIIQPLKMSEPGAHAIYQYQAQETPKTCGVDDTNINETIMTKTDFSSSSQEKQEFLKSRKYIQLYMVVDNSMYTKYKGRNDKIQERIYGIINFVNQVYKPLNIFVALTGLEIWSNGDHFEVVSNADTNLKRFSEWREKTLLRRQPHDNAQFITNIDFDGSTVGLAYTGSMCTDKHSAGVIQDHSTEYIHVAATLAHEMGHNLGMNHDDQCYCPAKSCIMAPSLSGSNNPEIFSSCSHKEYQNFILNSMPLCMKDRPTKEEILSAPVCGNKFTERGEECDCGTEEECTDKCCDAATCRLKEGAQCTEGECCSDCKVKSAGSVCRPAKDECDLSDMCDGRSSTCPSDRFQINGSPCKNGEGYCYNGKCPTLRSQCETYWGAGAVPAKKSCYEPSQYTCSMSRYGQCGVLVCSLGMSKPTTNGYCSDGTCKTLRPEVFVESGTKCDDSRVCVNGRCTAVPTARQSADCAAKCPGHSVCDHELQCNCKEGWAPPNCDTRADKGNLGTIMLAVFIVFVVLILIIVASVFFRKAQRKRQRNSAGKDVANPTFSVQNQTPQQPSPYPYKPQAYQQPAAPPQRPMYPPIPPPQSCKPNYRR
ncbi:zinc metalloproteinase-disintegrin-like halysase [Leptodactylus fuscus]